ncbi:hypothetical protein VA249_14650 [Vibrio alfacsensis]|uniref:hypothetical protein n=1 Tax=Vibrio alfacsensis TaxID=1074311 RepID=UPI001BEFAD23|nr:hypothetical protein [Vibrio alfacsensis]BBM64819.1 hypothetical protein VA249_14650 [Vibrio alfacsensis]
MKRLFLLMLFSSVVSAHGHSPQRFDKYVMDAKFELKFEVMNGFDKNTCFDIEVDGEIKPEMRKCLPSQGRRKMSVWLDSPADVQTRHFVCSIADIPGMKTRMCTDTLTLFPAERLGLSE